MRELGHEFHLAALGLVFLLLGLAQFGSHDIEALGKAAEDIAPVHLEGFIEIAGCNISGEILEFVKRPDDIPVYPEQEYGNDNDLDECRESIP